MAKRHNSSSRVYTAQQLFKVHAVCGVCGVGFSLFLLVSASILRISHDQQWMMARCHVANCHWPISSGDRWLDPPGTHPNHLQVRNGATFTVHAHHRASLVTARHSARHASSVGGSRCGWPTTDRSDGTSTQDAAGSNRRSGWFKSLSPVTCLRRGGNQNP